MREAELMDGLEDFTERRLFVSQQLAGQLLQDQRDVVQDHGVLKLLRRTKCLKVSDTFLGTSQIPCKIMNQKPII